MSIDKDPKWQRPMHPDEDELAYGEEPEPLPHQTAQNKEAEQAQPTEITPPGAKVESIEPAPPHAKKAKARSKGKRKTEAQRIEEAMPEDREGTYGL